MEVLLDTNLLLRCIQPSHPLHAVALAAMKELVSREDRLCVVPQILQEFYVVCTRPPAEYGGLGMTSGEAVAEIDRLAGLFELIPDSSAIHPEWLALVSRVGVVGKGAHDARVVAAMTVAGLGTIATFNGKDFARYEAIQVLNPAALAASWDPRSKRA